MTKKRAAYRRTIQIDGVTRPYSHYVWHENTGYWTVRGEVIHHIDGDHQNDDFSNLQLMSDFEHRSLHHLGKHLSEETRAKMSEAMSGEKNPGWKGDDASPGAKRWRGWKAKRRANRKRMENRQSMRVGERRKGLER